MKKSIVGGLTLALAASLSLTAPSQAAPSTTAAGVRSAPVAHQRSVVSARVNAATVADWRRDRRNRDSWRRQRPSYEAQQPALTVERAVTRSGSPVLFSASGFPQNSTVKIWIEGPSGAPIQINGGQNGIIVNTDARGRIWADVAGFQSGDYRIIVSGGSDWDKDIYADARFTVVGGDRGGYPGTGNNGNGNGNGNGNNGGGRGRGR